MKELSEVKGYLLKNGGEPFYDMNFYVRPPLWEIDFHSHDYMQFLVVMDGALYVSVDKKQHLLTKGDGYLVPPGIRHRLYTESGYTQFGANFYLKNQTDLMGIVGQLMEFKKAMIFEKLSFLERTQKMEALFINGNSIDTIRASVIVCEGLTECLERLEYGENGRVDRRITEYMERHIADKMHVEDIARHFCMSPSQLQRLSHQYFGMSIMTLYNQKRVNKAKVLLRSTESSINEIAGAVGFEEMGNFSAFFFKHTGETPSKYRIRKKGKAAKSAYGGNGNEYKHFD